MWSVSSYWLHADASDITFGEISVFTAPAWQASIYVFLKNAPFDSINRCCVDLVYNNLGIGMMSHGLKLAG